MFNRTKKGSKNGGGTQTPSAVEGSSTTARFDTRPIKATLEDEEVIRHIVASERGVRYSLQNETSEITAPDGGTVYLVVTNRQLFVVRSDRPGEPEIGIELARVDAIGHRTRLTSTRLSISTADATLLLVPGDSDAADDVVDYVSRLSAAWADFYKAYSKLREAMDDVAAAVDADEDPTPFVQRARTRIAATRECINQHGDAPKALMRGRIEPIEDELDRLRVEPRIDRIESLVHEAIDSREDRRFEDSFSAILEARDRVGTARSVLQQVELETTTPRKRLDNCEGNLVKGARIMLDGAEQACHRALAAEDPDDAIDAWDAALARYRGALAAGWGEFVGIQAEELRYQLSWVVGNLIDALAARAENYETEGDLLGEYHEHAVEHYGNALEDLQRARNLAAEHPHASPDRFMEPLDRLEKKHELSKWEWGSVA